MDHETVRDYFERHFASLFGAQLRAIDTYEDEFGSVFPVMLFRTRDGIVAIRVMRDPEGNGGGWLSAPEHTPG